MGTANLAFLLKTRIVVGPLFLGIAPADINLDNFRDRDFGFGISADSSGRVLVGAISANN